MLYIIFQEFNLQLFADGFRKTWNYCIVHNSKKGFDFRPARRNEKFLCEFEHDLFCSSKRTQNLIVKKSKSYLGQKKTCKIDSMGSFFVKKCQICERSKFILWKVKLVKIDSHCPLGSCPLKFLRIKVFQKICWYTNNCKSNSKKSI